MPTGAGEKEATNETTNDLRKDIDMLAEKVDSHMEDSKDRWEKVTNTTEVNALNITKVVEAMEKQTAANQGLVEAWSAANGFYRVIKWLSGLGGIGALLSLWLLDKFPGLK
jgi:hypothetical protein